MSVANTIPKDQLGPRTDLLRTGSVGLLALLGIHLIALIQLPLLLLPKARRIRAARRVTIAFLRLLVRGLVGFGVAEIKFEPSTSQALDELRRKPRGVIIVANHPGYLDALILMARLDCPCCVSKADLRRVPGLAMILYANDWPTNKDPIALHHRLQQELELNRPILLLPEGTRTPRDKRLGRLKAGVGVVLLARDSQVPLLPLRIDANPRWPMKGDSLVRSPRLPIRYSYRIAAAEYRIPPDQHPKLAIDTLRQQLES